MATTVLDSTDIPGILADAGVTLDAPAPKPGEGDKVDKPVDSGAAKVDKAEPAEHTDDEDENGLTAEQKAGLTEKMQKVIGKKHRQRMEAEEFAAAQYAERKMAEDRAARLEQELAEFRSKSTPPKAQEAPAKPDRKDFADDYAYVDAMIKFGVEERLAEKAREDAVKAEANARAARAESIGMRMDRARELVPDFDEIVSTVDTPIPPYVAGYMEKSEMIAELGYHFAKNPDLLLSLAKLPPDEQLVKIGKIESILTPFEQKTAPNDTTSSKEVPNGQAKPAPSADTDASLSKPRSKAAPVITPLEGTGSAGITKDSKDMNIREAIEDYSKRTKVNLNLRKRH